MCARVLDGPGLWYFGLLGVCVGSRSTRGYVLWAKGQGRSYGRYRYVTTFLPCLRSEGFRQNRFLYLGKERSLCVVIFSKRA